MPAIFGQKLNELLVGSFTAAELNSGNRPYLAIVLDGQPGRVPYLSLLAFGANVTAADAPNVELIAQVARNFTPDPTLDIMSQIDDGGSALSPSRLVRPYFRFIRGAPFDRETAWPESQALEAGTTYTIALGIGNGTPFANGVDVYLLVNGRWGTPGERSPRLKAY